MRLAKGGFNQATLRVRNNGSTATSVTVTASAPSPIVVSISPASVLNDPGTNFPKALSSSEDPAYLYPAKLANDGDTTSGTNFWVSGPFDLSTSPQCVVFDLGASETVGRTVMTPRNSYGPKDFTIQTAASVSDVTDCTSQAGWTTRSAHTGVTNGSTITSTFTPAAARYVRARVTATWYHTATGAPPAQTQIRELQVYPN